MTQRFFKLNDDVYIPQRWHLDTPIDSQGRKVFDWGYTCGKPVHMEGRLRIPIDIAGMPLDFTEAGIGIPAVHGKVASMLAKRAAGDVQLIPADIEGWPEQYFVVVATRLIRCIDEKASRILFWTDKDGEPDRVGQYRDVRDMRIDEAKVGNAKVFRPEGWEVALVVSEEIKDAMDALGATGTRFQEV
jgi:hypothetical protein